MSDSPDPRLDNPDEAVRVKRILRTDRKAHPDLPDLPTTSPVKKLPMQAVDDYFAAADRLRAEVSDRELRALTRWRRNRLVVANNALLEASRARRDPPKMKWEEKQDLAILERILSRQENFRRTRRIYRPLITPLGVDPVEWARRQYTPGVKFVMPAFTSWTGDPLTICDHQIQVVLAADTRQGACLDASASGDFEVLQNRGLLVTTTELSMTRIGDLPVVLVSLLEDSARGRMTA